MLTYILRAHVTLSFNQHFKALKTLTWGMVVAWEAWTKPAIVLTSPNHTFISHIYGYQLYGWVMKIEMRETMSKGSN